MDDWVLVNDVSLISEIVHLDPLGKSDHDVLSFQLNLDNNNVAEHSEVKHNLNRGDYVKFRNILVDHDWGVIADMDVQETWRYVKKIIHDGMENCIPKISNKTRRNYTPSWMNKKAMRSIKKKYNLFKKYLSSKSGLDYSKYIQARNKCSKLLKVTNKEYEKNVAKTEQR